MLARHKHAASPAEHLSSQTSSHPWSVLGKGRREEKRYSNKAFEVKYQTFQIENFNQSRLTAPRSSGDHFARSIGGEKSSYHKKLCVSSSSHAEMNFFADATKLKFSSFPAWLLFDYSCKISALLHHWPIIFMFLITVESRLLHAVASFYTPQASAGVFF